MKLKQLLSMATAVALAVATITLPEMTASAATFATPEELITSVVETALAEITSSTKSDAITSMQAKITTSGDEVLFDGNTIGYWYSEDSAALYSNPEKESTVLVESSEGFKASPEFLSTILSDVNAGLTETYTPTTDDWSKIVGQYDISMGDVTIPANQWYMVSTTPDEFPTSSVANATNVSSIYNIYGTDLDSLYSSTDHIGVSAWMIDKNGKMFIQKAMVYIGLGAASRYNWSYTTLAGAYQLGGEIPYGRGSLVPSDAPLLKVSVCEGTAPGTTYANHANMYVALSLTDTTNSVVSTLTAPLSAGGDECMYNIMNPSETNKADVRTDNIVAYGFVLMKGAQLNTPGSEASGTKHKELLLSPPTASKTVVGNATLTRRIRKLDTLASDDVITVSADSWVVNDTDNLDDYLLKQQIATAGDTAEIAALAEVEALSFNVIVPTTLPIYVDSLNTTYVADNADIVNKSGAAVVLTDVVIIDNADSDWTLIEGTPTKAIGGKEYAFSTTIEKDRALEVNEAYPFQYSAKLSPTTEADIALELATVQVTVDWKI